MNITGKGVTCNNILYSHGKFGFEGDECSRIGASDAFFVSNRNDLDGGVHGAAEALAIHVDVAIFFSS